MAKKEGEHACRVDIWRLRFDSAMIEQNGWSLLDSSERVRAKSFRFEHDCRRFVLSHAFLRTVLAGYRDERPEKVAFTLGLHGKPRLANREDPLRFNLSHCDSTCLVAVTEGTEIGVDVEDLRVVADRDLIATSVLTSAEQEAMWTAAPELHDELFLRFWTRKEAVLKADGSALFEAPGSVETHINAPDCAVLRCAANGGKASIYRLFDLSCESVIAAVAILDWAGSVVLAERST
ncbi:MAG: 4'-phosphopantetheinyl transferase superfamily protein [Myxacorys chilensis ATA2-1-KO14]|nr:4'-phosphopantetheinyl transferase superfamily protein [Myxacorys chilensis ATA2-1-KO14]